MAAVGHDEEPVQDADVHKLQLRTATAKRVSCKATAELTYACFVCSVLLSVRNKHVSLWECFVIIRCACPAGFGVMW
jgi:hypothetical protein